VVIEAPSMSYASHERSFDHMLGLAATHRHFPALLRGRAYFAAL
jgi:hypothetical protein